MVTYGEICKFVVVFRGTGWKMQQNIISLNDLFSTIIAVRQHGSSTYWPTLQLV